MPPDASSPPEIGLNFIDTSTSVYGPGGATMTLNAFLVARCTRTFLPLGAPAMSSMAHAPSTLVQPSIPVLSKSNVSTGVLSGNLISAGAACAVFRRRPKTLSAPRVPLRRSRRVIAASRMRTSLLVQLLRHRLPVRALEQGDVRHRVILLHRR